MKIMQEYINIGGLNENHILECKWKIQRKIHINN